MVGWISERQIVSEHSNLSWRWALSGMILVMAREGFNSPPSPAVRRFHARLLDPEDYKHYKQDYNNSFYRCCISVLLLGANTVFIGIFAFLREVNVWLLKYVTCLDTRTIWFSIDWSALQLWLFLKSKRWNHICNLLKIEEWESSDCLLTKSSQTFSFRGKGAWWCHHQTMRKLSLVISCSVTCIIRHSNQHHRTTEHIFRTTDRKSVV